MDIRRDQAEVSQSRVARQRPRRVDRPLKDGLVQGRGNLPAAYQVVFQDPTAMAWRLCRLVRRLITFKTWRDSVWLTFILPP